MCRSCSDSRSSSGGSSRWRAPKALGSGVMGVTDWTPGVEVSQHGIRRGKALGHKAELN